MNTLTLDISVMKNHQTEDPNLEALLYTFRQLCEQNEIRIPNLVDESWKGFKKVFDNFSLHGEPMVWLVVSLFLTWKSKLIYQQYFHLDLIQILNTSHIKMSEFLIKSKRWVRMSNLEPDLIPIIDRMMNHYSNSSTLFFRYIEKYFMVFNFFEESTPVDTTYNKRKKRRRNITENELFHFTWTMFICVKSFCVEFNEDHINQLHLLTCCLQFVYNSVKLSPSLETKLLNKNSSAFLNFYDIECIKGENIPNLSYVLFPHEFGGFYAVFSEVQKRNFSQFLSEMIKQDIIRWDAENPDTFLEPDNFAYTVNRLVRYYLEQIITHDIIDERQFLLCLSENDFNAFKSVQLEIVINSCKHNQQDCLSPFSSPTKLSYNSSKIDILKSVGKIFMNFSQFCPEIQKFTQSSEILNLISQITNEVFNIIKSHEIAEVMVNNYEIVRGVYYKLLISIVNHDEFRSKALHSLERVLRDKSFHCLILSIAFETCAHILCVNRVLFPWILRILDIDSFEFFKIIELVIKSEPRLTRDFVKYFNKIEESIVSYNAWCSNSLLFKYIDKNGSVPTLNDVNFPYSVDLKIAQPQTYNEDIQSDKFIIESVTTGMFSICKPATMSTTSLFANSLHGKKLENVSRNLFQISNEETSQPDYSKNSEPKEVHHFRITKGPEYYLTPKVGTNIKIFTPISNISDNLNGSSTHSSSSGQNDSSNQSKVLSALVFFMRKLYHLASTRLLNLCNFLKMDADLKSRCWTCLEYIIVKCHHLLEEHYLDQLIMCCVYAVGRSSSINWSFNDIIKWYKNQDYYVQSAYKRVEMSPVFDNDGLIIHLSDKQEHGDLITYYNKIFLKRINNYLYTLFTNKDQPIETLSPLPCIKSIDNFKARQLTNYCSVFVSPKKSDHANSNEFMQVYKFQLSPFSDKMTLACEEFQDILSPTKRRYSSINACISPELLDESPQKLIKRD